MQSGLEYEKIQAVLLKEREEIYANSDDGLEEIFMTLRKLGEPVTFFAETNYERYQRMKKAEFKMETQGTLKNDGATGLTAAMAMRKAQLEMDDEDC